MRRAELEIKNRDGIIDILRRANTIRLAMHDEPFPYIVPLSFGFEDDNGKLCLYVHGAMTGRKHELLKRNNNVCIEADIFHRYVEKPSSLTCEYESVIGFGTAEVAEGAEAVKGLDLICSHCGFHGYVYDHSKLAYTRVYKISISAITGKRNF